MKINMSKWDGVIRVTIASIILLLLYVNIITGVWSIVFGVVAGIFIITGMTGVCPLYGLLGLSTRPKENIKS